MTRKEDKEVEPRSYINEADGGTELSEEGTQGRQLSPKPTPTVSGEASGKKGWMDF